MKRKYEVRWYDHNLSLEQSRRFFTDFAANFFSWYLEYRYEVKTWVVNHEE